MCSVNEVDFESDQFMVGKEKCTQTNNCRQCSKVAQVVLRGKDSYCKTCFIEMVTHKFRSTIGKTKIMKKNDKVLICYSGGPSSTVLLHLIYQGMHADIHKKIIYEVVVCYIDDGVIFELSQEEREQNKQYIRDTVRSYNLQLYIHDLEECMSNPETEDSSKKTEKLQMLLEGVKSSTAREDLIFKLKQKLLLRIANKLNCCKLFTAEVGTDLAIKLLSNVAQGAGSSIHTDVGFCDQRNKQTAIIRPLRELSNKEVVFYNVFNSLEPLPRAELVTRKSRDSIQHLTEAFVLGLQDEFPSTVNTVFRTGDKLGGIDLEETEMCVLCGLSVSFIGAESSAVTATTFSKHISTSGPRLDTAVSADPQPTNIVNGVCEIEGNTSGEKKSSCCLGGCSSSRERTIPDMGDISKCFCYSCQLILRDVKNLQILPDELLKEVKLRIGLNQMKDQISNFLL